MSYPLPSFHFQVNWGGSNIGFTRVRNLSMHIELIQSTTGANPETSNKKQAGRTVYENILLERSVHQGDNEFYEWWNQTQRAFTNGEDFLRDMTISLLNNDHEPVVNWKIKHAFPVRLSYSDLDAMGSKVLTEVLEIACERIFVEND